MNPETEPMAAQPAAQAAAQPTGKPARLPWLRVFYWQVRRELWEHPAVWVAPATVAAFAALIHFLSGLATSHASRAASLADPKQAGNFMMLYGAATMAVLVSGLLVGVLYSLGALQGERRDRSILFWKSMPVSDTLTVLAKAFVPIVVIPVVVLGLILVQTLVMVALQTVVWQVAGFEPQLLWDRLNLPFLWLDIAHALPFIALWYAPLYAWLLAASAWARRVAFLWAAAPFVAFLMVEHTALHMTPAHWMLERRLGGGLLHPFSKGGDGKSWFGSAADLDTAGLYSLPGLWIGVAVAAVFLFTAIRLRRARTPN